MSEGTILVIEDDADIRNLLHFNLEKEGFTAIEAGDGVTGLAMAREQKPSLVLLDLMLPGMDGFEVCRRLGSSPDTAEIPVLMLTARGEEMDRVVGLSLGADDYVVKPFSAPEVMARVKAILRRLSRSGDAGQGRQYGNLVFQEESGRVLVAGKTVRLTHKEADLLLLFTANPGQLFSRDKLLDKLWGMDYTGDTRTVDTHIRRLRAKLEQAGLAGCAIGTVWGRGYRWEVMS